MSLMWVKWGYATGSPQITVGFETLFISSREKVNNRITVLLTCNMMRTIKMKPSVWMTINPLSSYRQLYSLPNLTLIVQSLLLTVIFN
jgi:hypothetical protein